MRRIWNLFLSLFADLGSEMDPDGAMAPHQGDLGSDMDPNG